MSQTNTSIIRARLAEVDGEHEPILTRERIVRTENGSLYANLPAEAAEIAGFQKGADIQVHIFQDSVTINLLEEDQP